ncbi:MAG: extracellular solute-binding protein [Bacteriovoracaceae bacterium]|nr:extracellular solute-binding protein [Bacteroidota bacterium]
MNTIQKILVSAAALFVLIVLIVFLPNSIGLPHPLFGEPDVQKVYFADHISPAHKAVIELFNERHRGRIEVVAVDLPFSKFSTNERKELLARSLRSKSDRLDVFSVDYIWTPRFAKWCEELDPYFADFAKAKIISPTIQSCIANGKLVAMPLYIDIGMMYYRSDIIRTLPDADDIERKLRESMTWDELLALRTRLGYGQRSYYIFQADDYEGLVCNYFEIARSIDKDFFAGNSIDLKSPAARQALQLMVDFVYTQKIAPKNVVEYDENKSYEYMLQSDAVFVRGWPNFLENFKKTYSDTSKFRHIERAPLPRFAGKSPTSVYGGWNLMVSKFSTKKEAAIEFIRFLQTEEVQKKMFELGGYIPVNHDVYADTAYLSNHEDLVFYRKLVDHGFHRPSLEDYTQISDVIAHYVHLAIKGEMTVDKALEEASLVITTKRILLK